MNRGYTGYYKGVLLRSSYEYAYARYLDYHGISWRYEELTYNVGNRQYKPDFFIYQGRELFEVVEVKQRNPVEIENATALLTQLKQTGSIPALQVISYLQLLELYREMPFSL